MKFWDAIARKWSWASTEKGLPVQVVGNQMEYYGATVAERPALNTVPIGAIYMAVNTQEVWQSNGTEWRAV